MKISIHQFLSVLILLFSGCKKVEPFEPQINLLLDADIAGQTVFLQGNENSTTVPVDGFYHSAFVHVLRDWNLYGLESSSIFQVEELRYHLSIEFIKLDERRVLSANDLIEAFFSPRTLDFDELTNYINEYTTLHISLKERNTVQDNIEEITYGLDQCDIGNSSTFTFVSAEVVNVIDSHERVEEGIILEAKFDLELCSIENESKLLNGVLRFYFESSF